MSQTALGLYGVLTAVTGEGGLRIAAPGVSSPNIRLSSAVHMLRELLTQAATKPLPQGNAKRLTVLQFDDHAHHRFSSLAFGRAVGLFPLVQLIVDPYFYFARGFQPLRRLAEAGELPLWLDRADILFWRGRGSHNGVKPDGAPVTSLGEVPRVSAALHLRGNPYADVGLIGAWIQPQSDEEALTYFRQQGILRASLPMSDHSRYKFQLDIDGVANAWATMERFLCGSCVLKVGTPFEMWFYNRLRPWEHFIPVKADLSDIDEQLDWCLTHDGQAREIARAGQAVALSLTYEHALNLALTRLGATAIILE
ncbi:glycosyl transferase family 90 [Caulobacter sp. S45]|uniref:glycosyl transferase family 90 n=1 Tax=Caulobacter sp. S45 TaxID=1641861 RepID=UPI00157767AC|nr:glycosyl transferase family 90 [Caulobacter sp. S45]